MPDPFVRAWPRPDVCVQLRRGPERVWVRGASFSRDEAGARRILADADRWRAVFCLGGEEWCTMAELGPEGDLLGGPYEARPAPPSLVGVGLPGRIRAAFSEALPPRVPALARDVVARVLAEVPIHFGNPGLSEGICLEGRIVLHAGMLEVLASHPGRALEVLARAVEPLVMQLAIARLNEAPPVAPHR